MFWCYNCSQNCSTSNCCSKCSSQAIQQITQVNNPSSFKPFQICNQIYEHPLRSLDSLYRDLFSSLISDNELPISSARFRRLPSSLLQLTYVILMDDDEEEKKCLSQDQINKLKRIQLEQECSICQQAEKGLGIQLQCTHKFHQGCIKPWLKQNNTCPCCRKQMN